MADLSASINTIAQQQTRHEMKNQDNFQKMYQYIPGTSKGLTESVSGVIKRKLPPCGMATLWAFICRIFPIFKWLPEYSIKKCLVGDIIAGVTIGIIQIPQGMSFAMIGTMPPVTGLYTAFVTPAVYFFTGTFKYGIMGSSAICNVILGKIITQELQRQGHTELAHSLVQNVNGTSTNSHEFDLDEFKIQVATTSAFVTGWIMIALGVFRLGYISVYLSKPAMQGSVIGLTCVMLTTQFPPLIGITIHSHHGMLSFFYNWIEIFRNISGTNLTVVILSLISITFLIVSSQIMTRYGNKHLPFTIPTEIFLVVGTILAAYYLHLNEKYNVPVLGHVPTGAPSLTIPSFSMIPHILSDCIVNSVFVYNVIITQSRFFEQREGIRTDLSQEFIAVGISNIVGSFFSSYASSTVLIRALIVSSAGATSQVTSFVSAILLIVVLMVLAPLFESLPHCVLSAINVVVMASILKSVTYYVKVWRISKPDACIAIVTTVISMALNLELGLAVGISLSIIGVLLRSQRARVSTLGNIEKTDIYIDVTKYNAAKEIDSVKILHFGGPLIYANADYFRQKVRKSLEKSKCNQYEHESADTTTKLHKQISLILDFSSVNFVDSCGLETLDLIQGDCVAMQNVHLALANCQDHVFNLIKRHLSSYKYLVVFPTIHDAVLCASAPSIKENGIENAAFDAHI